jgi:tetratricopeptide (TPR) repeat protein
VLGPEHTLTLDTSNNLGLLYADQGKLDEAEKMCQRAMHVFKNALCPKLASTYLPALNTTENPATLYQDLGRMGEAIEPRPDRPNGTPTTKICMRSR